jgi:hypothetical protein
MQICSKIAARSSEQPTGCGLRLLRAIEPPRQPRRRATGPPRATSRAKKSVLAPPPPPCYLLRRAGRLQSSLLSPPLQATVRTPKRLKQTWMHGFSPYCAPLSQARLTILKYRPSKHQQPPPPSTSSLMCLGNHIPSDLHRKTHNWRPPPTKAQPHSFYQRIPGLDQVQKRIPSSRSRLPTSDHSRLARCGDGPIALDSRLGIQQII